MERTKIIEITGTIKTQPAAHQAVHQVQVQAVHLAHQVLQAQAVKAMNQTLEEITVDETITIEIIATETIKDETRTEMATEIIKIRTDNKARLGIINSTCTNTSWARTITKVRKFIKFGTQMSN